MRATTARNKCRVVGAVAAILLLAVDPVCAATDFERQVLATLNAVRADPDAYAVDLERYRAFYQGRILRLPDGGIPFRTQEGVAPLLLAIPFLHAQPHMAPLEQSGLLEEAARVHARYQSETGTTGHYERAGFGPGERVAALGGGVEVAEVITYGPRDPAEMIRQLVIDDGVPDRGHRRILFDPSLRYAGVACGPHRQYRTMCVIDLARVRNGGGSRSPEQWLHDRAARFTATIRGALTR